MGKSHLSLLHLFLLFFFFFNLVKEILKQKKQLLFFGCPLSMWDLSSLTRNGTCTPCIGSAES